MLACVQRFFATVQPLVPLVPADYVMDLAVDVNSGSVHVIELNPFGPPDGMGTGAVMFNLDVPEDKAILFGEAPFQFRVVESPVPGVSKLIKGKWRTFLQKEGFIQLG